MIHFQQRELVKVMQHSRVVVHWEVKEKVPG
jgi:hypothetical protein